jgi:hypothetical protein
MSLDLFDFPTSCELKEKFIELSLADSIVLAVVFISLSKNPIVISGAFTFLPSLYEWLSTEKLPTEDELELDPIDLTDIGAYKVTIVLKSSQNYSIYF